MEDHYKSKHVFERMFSFHLEQSITYFDDTAVYMGIVLAEALAVKRKTKENAST